MANRTVYGKSKTSRHVLTGLKLFNPGLNFKLGFNLVTFSYTVRIVITQGHNSGVSTASIIISKLKLNRFASKKKV